MTTSPERGVEETHNTREWIEEIEHQAKQHIASLLGYLQQIHDSGQYRCAEIELEKVLENVELLTKTHHQELQKARENERENINNWAQYTFAYQPSVLKEWEAMYYRMTQDQSELDQTNK